MEPHGLTWARMGLHYFIDFMSEASVDWGRIVVAKPASPVFMISHMNGLEAQISSIFRRFQREEMEFNCGCSIDTSVFLLWKLQKKEFWLLLQYRQPRFPSLKMAEDAYFRDLLRIPKQEKWVDFCLQYRQRHYMLLKMPLYLDLDVFHIMNLSLIHISEPTRPY